MTSTALEFTAPCPQCGADVRYVAHQSKPYDFDIHCDCDKKRWRR